MLVFGLVLAIAGVFIGRAGFQTLAQLGPVGAVFMMPFAAFLVEGILQIADALRDRWRLQGLRLVTDDGASARLRLPRTPLHTLLAMIAMPGAMALMFVWAISLGLARKALRISGTPNPALFAIPILTILGVWMTLTAAQRRRRERHAFFDLLIDRRARTIRIPLAVGGPRSFDAPSLVRLRVETTVSGSRARTAYSSVNLDLRNADSIQLCRFRDHERAADALATWIGAQLAIPVQTASTSTTKGKPKG